MHQPCLTLRLALIGLAVTAAACQHVAPAPIDATANGARLAGRSLDDPAVVAALARHEAPRATSAWSLDELTLAAWILRTDVARAHAEVAVARASTNLESRRPNPSLSVTTERIVNEGAAHPWVVGPALALTLETGHKRAIRRQRALAAENAVEWQFGETLWSARAAVRAAYLDRTLAAELVALDEAEAELRRAYLAWIDTLLEHGAATAEQRLLALQALSESDNRLALDRAALATTAATLAAAVGISSAELAKIELVSPDFAALPTIEAQDVSRARDLALANRLDVRRALAEYEVAEQDLRTAIAAQYPSVTLAPGTLADQADHKITLGLDLPLPLRQSSDAAIRQAVAARAVAAAKFDEIQAAALAAIDSGFAQFGVLREALAAAERSLAEARQVLTVTQRRVDLGGASRGDLLAAELAVGVRQRNAFEARRALLAAVTALENGIERPLFPASAIEATTAMAERLAESSE